MRFVFRALLLGGAAALLATAQVAKFATIEGQWYKGSSGWLPVKDITPTFVLPLELTWSTTKGASSFKGSFTVTLPPETPAMKPGYIGTFVSGTLPVTARFKGTWTSAEPALGHGVDARVNIGIEAFRYQSTNATLGPCTVFKDPGFTSSPIDVDVTLTCQLDHLARWGDGQRELALGNVGFTASLRPYSAGDPIGTFGGWFNFTYGFDTGPDLSVARIEFVQAVQTGSDDTKVPLVAGKRTVVRVFANTHGKDVNGVDARLRLVSGGEDGATRGPLKPWNGPIQAMADWMRNWPDDSLNFLLPDAWVNAGGPLTVEAEVLVPSGVVDPDPSNNKLSQTETFSTQPGWFYLAYLPVCYQPPGATEMKCPEDGIATADRLLRSIYPLDPRKYRYEPVPVPPRLWEQRLKTDAEDLVLENALRKHFIQSNLDRFADQLMFWLPQIPGYGVLGSSDPIWSSTEHTGRQTYGQFRPGALERDSMLTFAHELAHNFGRRHTDLTDGCDAIDSGTNWPYKNSMVQEPGFDTSSTVPLFRFAESKDLMSYCPEPMWISPATYKGILTSGFQPVAKSASVGAPAYAAQPVNILLVSGTVDKANTHAVLDPIYRLQGTPLNDLTPADYCIRVSSATQPPVDRCFALTFTRRDSGLPVDPDAFAVAVPWVEGVNRVALLYQGRELTARTPSANPPQIQITSPQVGETWNGGNRSIAWSAQDTDGDGLIFTVLYSSDNGATWLSLAEDIIKRTFDIPTQYIRGGTQVKFRVLASDGFYTASADVGPIHLIQQPTLRVDATPINLRNAVTGQSRVSTFPITNPGTGPLTVSAISSANTLFKVIAPIPPFLISAGGKRDIEVLFAPTASGVANGSLRFSSDDAAHPTQDVPIRGTGIDAPAPDAEVTPLNVEFGTVQLTQSATWPVVLRNYGPAKLTISSVTSSNAQFTVSGVKTPLDLGTEQSVATVSFTPQQAGLHTATLTVATSDPAKPSLQVALRGTGVAAAGPRPAINAGGVADAAQYKSTVTPGGIASVFGTDFAGEISGASTVPLPRLLSGVQVKVNSFDAPLFFISPGQVNFQIPYEVPSTGTAQVVVVRNGVASAAEPVSLALNAPTIFMHGSAPVILRYPANDEISAANPAKPNDVLIIYATGIGGLSNVPPTGGLAPSDPVSSATVMPTATLGGAPVQVAWAGMSPGSVGLAQINIQLPATLPAGTSLPLDVRMAGFQSPIVQLAVQSPAPPSGLTARIAGITPASPKPQDRLLVSVDIADPHGLSGQYNIQVLWSDHAITDANPGTVLGQLSVSLDMVTGSSFTLPVQLPSATTAGLYYAAVRVQHGATSVLSSSVEVHLVP